MMVLTKESFHKNRAIGAKLFTYFNKEIELIDY